ncbi:MAG: hypothetical protein AUK26_05040 [Syntrophaceae bacterium CG2_30_58_14]|nr:MAG: hypothetical protein AUK26_05040 [Syntrophaceae bacterium CG2_30_58_14]
MMKRIMRGVQDIKTLSGRADEGTIPYKAYMKLSILEMEKFRRGKEKQSALERVHHIDQRFRDIEAERQKIMTALEAKGIRRQRLPGLEELPTTEAPRTTTGPFKIRY